MDLINGLVAEAAMSSIPASSSSSAAHVPAAPTESLKPSDADQTLLLIGFNDWDTLLSNNPTGLEQYHRVSIPTPVKKVFTSSTSFHFFVLGKDGSLFVMGKNDHGQLGTGDLISQKAPLKLPTGELDSPVVKVATGRSHTLVLLENGRVFGCGSNSFGQLGLGDNKTAVRDFLKLTALPLENVVDISAGENFSMACTRGGKLLVFGHPEYGQLGLGTTGQYIKDGGKKGAAIQYHFVTRPQQIQNFFSKDAHGKVTEVITADNIRIRKVAAGKNHAMCLEDWENGGQNRLFAWGFGGYGRLGHNGSSDELVPREVSYFNQSAAIKLNPQKYLRSIEACSSFSLAGENIISTVNQYIYEVVYILMCYSYNIVLFFHYISHCVCVCYMCSIGDESPVFLGQIKQLAPRRSHDVPEDCTRIMWVYCEWLEWHLQWRVCYCGREYGCLGCACFRQVRIRRRC